MNLKPKYVGLLGGCIALGGATRLPAPFDAVSVMVIGALILFCAWIQHIAEGWDD